MEGEKFPGPLLHGVEKILFLVYEELLRTAKTSKVVFGISGQRKRGWAKGLGEGNSSPGEDSNESKRPRFDWFS